MPPSFPAAAAAVFLLYPPSPLPGRVGCRVESAAGSSRLLILGEVSAGSAAAGRLTPTDERPQLNGRPIIDNQRPRTIGQPSEQPAGRALRVINND